MNKTETQPSTDLDWCYIEGCDKHPSPSGPPKRIQPTWGQLADWTDEHAKWVSYHLPQVSNTMKVQIDELIQTAETPEEHIVAHHLAVSAGMCYWSIKEGNYIWRK